MWMKNAHVGSVSEAFKIPVREDAPSTIPGELLHPAVDMA